MLLVEQAKSIICIQNEHHGVLESCTNAVCFLLGNSLASEIYMPTFRNNLFHLHKQGGVEWLNLKIVGVSIREKVWLENSLSQ